MSDIVQVEIILQDGCTVADREYQVVIVGFIGGIDLDDHGGQSEVDLIKEAVDNFMMVDLIQDKAPFLITANLKKHLENNCDHQIRNEYFEVDGYEFMSL